MRRSLEDANKVYMKIYQQNKKIMSVFEGERIFRSGNSWKRIGYNGEEIILFDDVDNLYFTGIDSKKKVFKTIDERK